MHVTWRLVEPNTHYMHVVFGFHSWNILTPVLTLVLEFLEWLQTDYSQVYSTWRVPGCYWNFDDEQTKHSSQVKTLTNSLHHYHSLCDIRGCVIEFWSSRALVKLDRKYLRASFLYTLVYVIQTSDGYKKTTQFANNFWYFAFKTRPPVPVPSSHTAYKKRWGWLALSVIVLLRFWQRSLSLKQQENPCLTSLLFDWQLWQTGGTYVLLWCSFAVHAGNKLW